MVAKTVQSRKAKGRNLQKEVVSCILKHFPFLDPSDVQSTSMGASGVDVKLSKAAQDVFPFAVECKATEKINIWQAWEQAKSNSGKLNPLLVHRKSRTKALAVVELEYLLQLHADCDKLGKRILQLTQGK
jgi:hypothetical protein